MRVINNIEPVYSAESKILILGTLPSPKSREYGFFYSHPKNRFWLIMEELFNLKISNNGDKRGFLLSKNIAMWDVLKSCTIEGASDGTIKDIEVNDLQMVINASNIETVFTTGLKATALYKKHCLPITKLESIYLPSTSPANCRNYTLKKLIEEYSIILNHLQESTS